MTVENKKILVIDNFDSFTFNLVDYFLQLDCEVEVFRNTAEIEIVEKVDPDLIVFSPGPSVPKNAGNMLAIIEEYQDRYPMFGVCLGLEAFVEAFGGTLKFVHPVHGRSSTVNHQEKGVFKGLKNGFEAGRYHSLVTDKVPDCFDVTATCSSIDDEDLVMGLKHKKLPIEGVQFHPESVLTMKAGAGKQIIKNVIDQLCS